MGLLPSKRTEVNAQNVIARGRRPCRKPAVCASQSGSRNDPERISLKPYTPEDVAGSIFWVRASDVLEQETDRQAEDTAEARR